MRNCELLELGMLYELSKKESANQRSFRLAICCVEYVRRNYSTNIAAETTAELYLNFGLFSWFVGLTCVFVSQCE